MDIALVIKILVSDCAREQRKLLKRPTIKPVYREPRAAKPNQAFCAPRNRRGR